MFFFSADHHFCHANIIDYCNRPFSNVDEMNEVLIERHNEVVRPSDTTVFAGDFALDKYENVKEIIGKLNGDKIFLKGSHDRLILKNYPCSDIWKKAINGQQVVVCHYAMRVWPASHYNSWQLFGHSHGKLETIGKQIDIGVDTNNFYPYSFDEVSIIMKTKPDNFDVIKKTRHSK